MVERAEREREAAIRRAQKPKESSHPKQQKGRHAIPIRRSLWRHAEAPQQGDKGAPTTQLAITPSISFYSERP